MTGLFIILLLVVLIAYFNDAWRSLERVRRVARSVCERAQVQLLDQSVVPDAVRVGREGARWFLIRHYRFEFATDGDRRYQGEITLHGRRVQAVSLEWPEGGRVMEADLTPGARHDP